LSEEKDKKRILVLCIDLDDDIGEKGKVKTPVVGRGNVMDAGIKLLLSDPEESDANAIFASIKTYDQFNALGYNSQVAIVAGSSKGEPYASLKVVEEINQVAENFKPTDVFIVTDGFGDEDIIPVVKARLPVSGVIRSVVKHSRSVEESYVILGRYIKMLFTDERFKKYTLGFSGILLVVYSLLSSVNLLSQGIFITAFLFGLIMLVKGFNLDVELKNRFYSIFGIELPFPYYVARIATSLIGYIFLLLGIVIGISQVIETMFTLNILTIPSIIANLTLIIGIYLKNGVNFMLFGMISLQISRYIVLYHLNKDEAFNVIPVLASLASSYPAVSTLGDFLINPTAYLRNMVYASLTSLGLFLVFEISLIILRKILSERRKGV